MNINKDKQNQVRLFLIITINLISTIVIMCNKIHLYIHFFIARNLVIINKIDS